MRTAHKLLHMIAHITVGKSKTFAPFANTKKIIMSAAITAVARVAVRLSMSSISTSVASAIGIAYTLSKSVQVAIVAINVTTVMIVVSQKSRMLTPF